MGVEGKYVQEIEKAPSILDDNALFIVGYNNLTGATTLKNIKNSIKGDTSSPSNNLFYSSKFIDDKLTDINDHINNTDINISSVQNNIDQLRVYVDLQDNSLLSKIQENANNIKKNRDHWQHVLYGDDTTNVDGHETGIIPSLQGDTLLLKKALYGGTSLKNSDGTIADMPSPFNVDIKQSTNVINTHYVNTSTNNTIPYLYRSIAILHNQIGAMFRMLVTSTASGGDLQSNLLHAPNSRVPDPFYSSTTISKGYYFNKMAQDINIGNETSEGFIGQIDKIWATINRALIALTPKVDFMYKTIAGSGTVFSNPYNTELGEQAVHYKYNGSNEVNVYAKNTTLGDVIGYFRDFGTLTQKETSASYHANNGGSYDFTHKYDTYGLAGSDTSVSGYHNKPLKYFNSARPELAGDLSETLKNTTFTNGRTNAKKEMTDISLLILAVNQIGEEIKRIHKNAWFKSEVSTGVEPRTTSANTIMYKNPSYSNEVHILSYGQTEPTQLAEGQVYLQYFD